jgi:hypothetical protein
MTLLQPRVKIHRTMSVDSSLHSDWIRTQNRYN